MNFYQLQIMPVLLLFLVVYLFLEAESKPWRIYRDGELVCPPPPDCLTDTASQMTSNVYNNKIKLISSSFKQY